MSAGYVDIFRLEIVKLDVPRPFAVVHCHRLRFSRSEPSLRTGFALPAVATHPRPERIETVKTLDHADQLRLPLQPILARR